MIEHVVRARELTKVYDTRRAVDKISFEVERGAAFGLLGPNGAGKSTTMRMIACRTPPTGGQLFVENLDVNYAARSIRSLIGVVPQENNLDPDLSVLANLLAHARYYNIPRAVALKRSTQLLQFINLSSRRDARIEQLSGGMKRRLMIARALLHEPRVLVLDEPTTGLDPHVRQEIWQRLEELRRTSGITILLSTHYMEEAEKLCERLLVLDQGRILASGAPRELVEQQVSRYALEVRDAEDLPLLETSIAVASVKRSGAHFYFAAKPELLAPLIKDFSGKRVLLRPSNLEDVFLQLISSNDDE
jgi:lipooligosaccharide transport system ATP-binding protein